MDMGKFIAEVRKRECLWDKRKMALSVEQRKVSAQLWQEVGKACKISKETAKTKWRSLRDHFYKLLKKVSVYSIGDTFYVEENEKPNWSHFNNLMFLLDTYNQKKQKVINIKNASIIDIQSSSDSDSCTGDEDTRSEKVTRQRVALSKKKKTAPAKRTSPRVPLERNTEANISVAEVKAEQETACERRQESFEDTLPPLAMVKPQLPAPTFTSIKRVYTLVDNDLDLDVSPAPETQNGASSKRIALESNVQSTISRDTDDSGDETENMAFFRSLLPFMKKLDPIQQLRVRMRCQESLLEEMGALNN